MKEKRWSATAKFDYPDMTGAMISATAPDRETAMYRMLKDIDNNPRHNTYVKPANMADSKNMAAYNRFVAERKNKPNEHSMRIRIGKPVTEDAMEKHAKQLGLEDVLAYNELMLGTKPGGIFNEEFERRAKSIEK